MEIHTSLTYHTEWCKSHLTWPFFCEVTFTSPCRRNIHSAHVDRLQLIPYYYSQCTCGQPTVDSTLFTLFTMSSTFLHSTHVVWTESLQFHNRWRLKSVWQNQQNRKKIWGGGHISDPCTSPILHTLCSHHIHASSTPTTWTKCKLLLIGMSSETWCHEMSNQVPES